MKSILLSIAFALLLISCSKKDNTEPDITIDPTNELVGTVWQRTINPELYNYLEFKTGKEVEFSSKQNGELSSPLVRSYTLNDKKVVYTIEGFNYTGMVSGDTLAVMGTSGFLMTYIKIR
jgi:DUF2075 family protein